MTQLIGRQLFDYVKINILKTTPGYCDEWVTSASIDFLLHPAKAAEIELFGEKDRVAGVRLCNCECSDDEFCFMYLRQTDPDGEHLQPISGLHVAEVLVKELHVIISDEEKKKKHGWLNKHTFSDDESLWDGYTIGFEENGEE